MGRSKRDGKVFEKTAERPVQGSWPGNKNIIGTFVPRKGQNGRSRRTQPPFGPVALDCAADLAAGGESDSQVARLGQFLRSGACLQHQSGGYLAHAALGAQKIGSVPHVVGA